MPFQTLLLALVAALWAVPAPGAQAAVAPGPQPGWRLPLEDPSVSRHFSFDPGRPFAPGQRRVARLAGSPGEEVRSPCTGTVTFAGALPGGRGVSVLCGRFSATLTGLGSASVRRGAVLVAGRPLGRLGRRGTLLFGARVAARRHGYLDPLALLAQGPGSAPLAPVLRPGPALRPRPRPGTRPRGTFPVAAVLLAGAWLGLGVAGSAVGLGIALRRGGPAGSPARHPRPAGR